MKATYQKSAREQQRVVEDPLGSEFAHDKGHALHHRFCEPPLMSLIITQALFGKTAAER